MFGNLRLIKPRLSLLLLLAVSPAAAEDAVWEQNKGDCDEVFKSWRTESVERLRDCVMSWEMYRDISEVDDNQRTIAQEAIEKLYAEGDERDAVMSTSALKRLGLKPRRLRTDATEARAPTEAVRMVAAEPDDRGPPPEEEPERESGSRPINHRASEAAFYEGKALFQGGQYPQALSKYLISADADPTFAPPLYAAARCYAMMDRPQQAVDALHRMKAIDSELARQLLRKAATDEHFASVRRTDAFKSLTGTASIQILNGAGESGMSTVRKFRDDLEGAGIPVAKVAEDRNPRSSTYLYAKPGFEAEAEEVRRQLQLGLIHSRPLDWPSPYDVILVYGASKGGAKWVDDEAEKAGGEDKKKKKAEEEAKKKEKEAAAQKKAEMKEKMEMFKMMQEMETEDAASKLDPTAGDPTEAIAPP